MDLMLMRHVRKSRDNWMNGQKSNNNFGRNNSWGNGREGGRRGSESEIGRRQWQGELLLSHNNRRPSAPPFYSQQNDVNLNENRTCLNTVSINNDSAKLNNKNTRNSNRKENNVVILDVDNKLTIDETEQVSNTAEEPEKKKKKSKGKKVEESFWIVTQLVCSIQ